MYFSCVSRCPGPVWNQHIRASELDQTAASQGIVGNKEIICAVRDEILWIRQANISVPFKLPYVHSSVKLSILGLKKRNGYTGNQVNSRNYQISVLEMSHFIFPRSKYIRA